jgi:hypothetical protein
MAIRYWNLILDASEKLAAFDEQSEETLNTFREALKRYGVEATPPRAIGANAEPGTGLANAGLGEGTVKEPSGARVGQGIGDAADGRGSGDGERRRASVGAVELGRAPTAT